MKRNDERSYSSSRGWLAIASAIGATAISSVIFSVVDAPQHLVEIEPAVQPYASTGFGGGQKVEQPQDV